MLKLSSGIHLSASDLVGHLNCRHLTNLDIEAVHGRLERPQFHDPLLEILVERGAMHERGYIDHLASRGIEVVLIEGDGITRTLADRTLAAMRAGKQVIAQAALLKGEWGGRADILMRVATPSVLGDWSYEVIDTKLARETKGGTILQLSLYSDLLARAQGLNPEWMHVVAPGSGFEPQPYRVAAYGAYYRHVKRRLERSLASRLGSAVESSAGKGAAATEIRTYPDPVEHCEICRWRVTCDARRRLDDHLCLVAGISRIQIDELKRREVNTTAKLAQVPLPLPWKPDRGAKQTYERVREQARIQVLGREQQRPIYETLEPQAGMGLAKLPGPSRGDVFFDLEGDPFVGEGGIEYLFGYLVLDDAQGTPERYIEEWAFTRQEEKRAFENFVDFVMARWARYPDMHVYHYAPYEPGALKRLMGRYASREDEIDRMLRGGVFVDLYSVVRHGIRASVERYSIKDLEVFYNFRRPVELPDARRALAAIQGCLELDDASGVTEDVKRTIAGYNRDDCVSALRLRDWLESIRTKLVEDGASIERPTAQSPEPSEQLDERQQKVAALIAQLTAGIPVDVAARTSEQQAKWILAHTLDWHRREQKSAWWEYYRLADLPPEDLLDERCALSGLAFREAAGGTARSPIHRYTFPAQEVELRPGDKLRASGGEDFGEVESISLETRTIDIRKRGAAAALHPPGVFKHDVVRPKPKPEALMRIAEHVAERGLSGSGPYQAARNLLLRERPQIGAEPLRQSHETPVEAALRIAPLLNSGVLAIQGPPGAGKTFTASRMICALVKAKKRVGVTANSHKVIRNLLDEVVRAADKDGVEVQCIQKPDGKQDDVHRIRFSTDNQEVLDAIHADCQVAAGTSWLWAREDAFEAVDVLFVDEAAQMSLADVLAVSQACKTLVLLGDPRQLEQPMQGSHPEGTDASALDHILAGKPTIGDTEGLFLEETWRLHPDICAFTSEVFYEGRLRSKPGLEVQAVKAPELHGVATLQTGKNGNPAQMSLLSASTGTGSSRITGSGLRYLPVLHEGNQSSSPEEADCIRGLVNAILSGPSTWIDREGVRKPVELKDILVIAPYNAQVFELQEKLRKGARIGTVDKFQGQEAPIVIYSMATSSHADAPRGMEFLYSLNRLNVATSRAQCICVLVGSPLLFEPECRTPEQMKMANAFCRYLEMARTP